MQIVCPSCGAANRLPEDRDPAAAKCGRCKNAVFTGAPVEVDAAGLDRHRRLTKGAAVLLDVWAPWCGPCRAMAPNYAAAATKLEPRVRLLKLNSEAHPAPASALGVSGIPALILFRDGAVVARQAGLMSAPQIIDWTSRALA